jgi:hypothetical protein
VFDVCQRHPRRRSAAAGSGHSSATEYESAGCGGAYPLAVTRDSMWAGIKPDRYGPTFTPRIIPPMRPRAISDARILMSRRDRSVACVAAMAAHATRVAAMYIGFMEALMERRPSRGRTLARESDRTMMMIGALQENIVIGVLRRSTTWSAADDEKPKRDD